MTTCQACSRKCEMFLCAQCSQKLYDELIALPWWLARLSEAAIGQVKLGDGGRGSTRREPFKGDDEVTNNGDATMLRKFLAAGRVNARASDLFAEIVNVLSTTIRDLCETRGVPVPDIQTPARMALWLAGSTSAVAADESAGETFSELCGLAGRIEKVVNRPMPPRLLGPCPGEHGGKRCNLLLVARPKAIEITCAKCKTTHNVERLETQLVNEISYYRFTRPELSKVLEWLDEVIPKQTLHDWIRGKNGAPPKLKPSGYRRPDGRFGISRHNTEDEPVYRLADVRRLRSEQRKVDA